MAKLEPVHDADHHANVVVSGNHDPYDNDIEEAYNNNSPTNNYYYD